jgi:hypothetical protein
MIDGMLGTGGAATKDLSSTDKSETENINST